MRREIGDPVELEGIAGQIGCRCSPLAFRRILANLIDNALRYGTRARITVTAEAGAAVLKVADDGAGIPSELVERLTGPFERLEESRGRHSGGAGLGLAIVKGLAESHGGSLSLANGAEGGLHAIVRLPSQPARPAVNA
jgi:signal transduction histidine kinase